MKCMMLIVLAAVSLCVLFKALPEKAPKSKQSNWTKNTIHPLTPLAEAPPPVQVLHDWNKPLGVVWKNFPSDVRFRVVWNATPPQAQKHASFVWLDVAGKPTRAQLRAAHRFQVLARDNEDAGGLKLSPNGSKLLYSRDIPSFDMDNAHDEWIANLSTGKSIKWQRRLFGADESWAPDSNRIAFIAGSTDTAGPERIARERSLCVGTASSADMRVLKTEDRLEDLTWSSNGDLFASISGEAQGPASIWKFSRAQSGGTVWQEDARSPLVSPDGSRVAFWSGKGENWGERPASLCVADADGTHRLALARVDESSAQMLWAPDSETLYLLTQHPEKVPDEEKSAQYLPVALSLQKWSVKSGEHKEVARLRWRALFGYGSCSDFFGARGFSRDAKYLFLQRAQRDYNTTENTLPLRANALYALRLSDSKLIPVAVWNNNFAINP